MLTGSRFKIQRKNSSTEHFPGPASRPCLCNQMATPPTSQYFLPVALAQAGIPLPVGENTSNSLSHGGTLGTTAFASSNELGHDKGGSRVRLTDQEKLLLVRLCVLVTWGGVPWTKGGLLGQKNS